MAAARDVLNGGASHGAGALPLFVRLLLRASGRGGGGSDGDSRRASAGSAAGIVGIACNVALSAGKGVVGALAGSVSIVADALNNLTDALSSIVGLIGFKLSGRPADEGHPFGHGRYEYIAASIVSVLVLVVGIELVIGSIRKIASPEPAEFNAVVAGVLLVSIAVKAWLARFNAAVGSAIGSQTLRATAADARNDAIATGAVLAAAVVSRLVGYDLDGWAGLAVGLFIAYGGIGLVREAADLLIGAAPDAREVDHIRSKILGYEGVLGTHDLMMHDYGPERRFASAHVEVSADMDISIAHDLLDRIEQDFLREERIEMTLHADPIVTDADNKVDVRSVIADAVRTVDERLSIHDVRVLVSDELVSASFDCVRPQGIAPNDDELAGRIFEAVAAVRPDLNCRVRFDDGYLTSARLDASELVNGAA